MYCNKSSNTIMFQNTRRQIKIAMDLYYERYADYTPQQRIDALNNINNLIAYYDLPPPNYIVYINNKS